MKKFIRSQIPLALCFYKALPFLLMSFALTSPSLYARDIVDTANKLSQVINQIGLALSVGGICLCGMYFVFGRADASAKLTHCLIGVTCIAGVRTLMGLANSIA